MTDLIGLVRKAQIETRESHKTYMLQVRNKDNENGKVCLYCHKPLPERHYISKYGGRYCNANCHTMFTED